MPKLDTHISKLLFDHECLIVPELGGFLSSYAPSRINTSRHLVSPPSKKIAFNVFLKQNDGLLANYIVQTENITYPEAMREIEGYVEQCNRELGAGKKFVIEKVGVLARDAESNLQFESFDNINYLKDSFGLSPVQFIPVHHNDFEHKVEKQLRDFISLRPSQSQPRQRFPKKKARLNALNTMLLTGSILWLCLNLYIVSPESINLASLNPFLASVSNKPSPVSESPASKSEIYTQPNVSGAETAHVMATVPSEVDTITSASQQFKSDELNGGMSDRNFFLIAGAFNSNENASKMQAELKAQGFANASILDNEGMNLVYYDGFASLEEAVKELHRMKESNKESWIFSR